jgi:hypothetical protein
MRVKFEIEDAASQVFFLELREKSLEKIGKKAFSKAFSATILLIKLVIVEPTTKISTTLPAPKKAAMAIYLNSPPKRDIMIPKEEPNTFEEVVSSI